MQGNDKKDIPPQTSIPRLSENTGDFTLSSKWQEWRKKFCRELHSGWENISLVTFWLPLLVYLFVAKKLLFQHRNGLLFHSHKRLLFPSPVFFHVGKQSHTGCVYKVESRIINSQAKLSLLTSSAVSTWWLMLPLPIPPGDLCHY